MSDEDRVGKLLFDYRSAALIHNKMSVENPRKANEAADRMFEIGASIAKMGSAAHQRFLLLLNNEEPEVRCWAATHALEFAPDVAKKALERLASGEFGLVSFNAKMTLQEWKAGRLKLFDK